MENEVITLINELIDNLSNLCKKDILDKIKNGPINWSDLCCYEAKEIGYKNWIVYIGEAGDCPYFCDYICYKMAELGYNIEVITEW